MTALGDVSRETAAKFRAYEALVLKWSRKINLIGPATAPEIRERHLKDSLRLLEFLPEAPVAWADLGSGGGFPAIPLSIARPDFDLHLIESDRRKATFLRTVIRELGLRATVIAKRIEAVQPLDAAVISARALAPLPLLLEYGARHGSENARHLYLKGRSWEDEVREARKQWAFELVAAAPASSSDGVVIVLENVRRVG